MYVGRHFDRRLRSAGCPLAEHLILGQVWTTVRQLTIKRRKEGEPRMIRNVSQLEPLWTIEDVAAYLRVLVQTLYQWRRKGIGPASKKCGRHLRYDSAAVRAWVLSDAA
jgi:hypothetical protein